MCEDAPWSEKSWIGDTNLERRKYFGRRGQRRWLPVCLQVSKQKDTQNVADMAGLTHFSGGIFFLLQICWHNARISVQILLLTNCCGLINCSPEVWIFSRPVFFRDNEKKDRFFPCPKYKDSHWEMRSANNLFPDPETKIQEGGSLQVGCENIYWWISI